MTYSRVLATIAIAEGIIIIFLVFYRVQIVEHPVSVGPLERALSYDCSDRKFEELVRKYPAWINFRFKLPNKQLTAPVLADCALLGRTNLVRVLLANGANLDDAVSSLGEARATNAIDLIQQAHSEITNRDEH